MKVFIKTGTVLLILIVSGLIAPQSIPVIHLQKQETESTLDATFLDLFNLGIKRIYTDIIWIKTLLESDYEHYKGHDDNSWMYHRFRLISKLDPKFINNYWFGGQYLSVIKDDEVGAKKLLEKGLEIYPDDEYILFYAASHHLIELNDKKTAIKYYEKIMNHPKMPRYIAALVARLKAHEGYLEESYKLMKRLHNEAPKDSPLKRAYEKRLYSVKAEKDLQCLNEKITKEGKTTKNSRKPNSASSLKQCQRVDLYGHPYIRRNGSYQSQIKWEKLRAYQLPSSQTVTDNNQ